jgi:hypothetical protein
VVEGRRAKEEVCVLTWQNSGRDQERRKRRTPTATNSLQLHYFIHEVKAIMTQTLPIPLGLTSQNFFIKD